MSKTIEQLRAQAAQIEEATRQGENTQIRVGGLFTDVIDFIAQIPVTETVLGPLLTALNNSGLLEPSDGQTLTFSIMKEGWTYSDALTQLKLSINGIEQTVTSNYEAFLSVKDQLQREVAATDQRVRNYKTDYDNSQIEYATWKSQTDTQISQYAAAIDTVTGQIISISGRVDTAFDQLDFVTNNLDAADKALRKLFNLDGLDYDDPDQAYTASWLYKNRQGIYGAAATFDEEGNILSASKLQVTINGIETEVSNATGQISSIRQSVDSISMAVAGSQQQINTINDAINGTTGNPGILQRLTSDENLLNSYGDAVSYIQQNRDSITATVGRFNPDGTLRNTSGLVTTAEYAGLFTQYMSEEGVVTEAEMDVKLLEKVDEKGVRRIISEADIKADKIVFTSNEFEQWVSTYKVNADDINWVFKNAVNWIADLGGVYRTVMQLDPQGNLTLTGKISADTEILDNNGNGTSANYLLGILNTLYNNFSAKRLTISHDGVAIDYREGAVQVVYKATATTVYLPNLGNLREALKKGSNDDFACQLVIANQTAASGSEHAVRMTGGTQDYDSQVTSSGSLPRVYRGTGETAITIEERETAIFFITYINKRFIASFILD